MKNHNTSNNGGSPKTGHSKIKNALSSIFTRNLARRGARTLAVVLSVSLIAGASATLLSACSQKLDNESSHLVLSSEAVDGAFNPFFYTSGADGEVVGMTQIGMLSSDDNGKPLAGADADCVALAYGITTTGTSDSSKVNLDTGIDEGYYTDYYFAIKDNVKFSDGTPLTINDVLFNIYMYLDPGYTGSSTMYSVDIQGLAAYRTQSTDTSMQQAFSQYFDSQAEARINAIKNWANDDNSVWSDESFGNFGSVDYDGNFVSHVKEDIAKAHALFKEELESDWNAAPDLVESYEEKYHFTEGWEIFLWQYGLITVTTEKNLDGTKTYKVDYNGWDTYSGGHEKDAMIDVVYRYMLGDGDNGNASDAYKSNIIAVVTMYATASNLRTYLASAEMTDYFNKLGELPIKTVSGITVEKGDVIYNEGKAVSLGGTYDILKIRINGVDPKAIQNFSFTVAPGHYYSSHWDEFSLTSGQEYFGVEFGNADFMTEVKTITVPLGAGPYRATTKSGSSSDYVPAKGEFLNNNVIYFERNEYFHLGTPVIKYIDYKVTSSTLMYDSVKTGEVYYASPSATPEMLTKLEGVDKETLGYKLTENLGYGYIGVNANYVHNINVRRAIMHAMNTNLCIEYYGNMLAQPIYRSMSKTLKDYYPAEATSYYEFDETGETSLQLVLAEGYTPGSDGTLVNSSGEKLKFTFTIAGDTTDHPAYNMLVQAAEILNNVGFDITVVTDASALSKLASGTLAVWAAAWSSSSDPDMYQVYHKDSSATSINAWGYPYLTSANGGTTYEKNLINELSVLIDEGRETTVVSERASIYSEALDLVMALAIELPTYQRMACYIYKNGVLDESTFYPNLSAYKSPLSEIWNVSFIEG